MQDFELMPPAYFRLDLTAWTLRRRSHNMVDRWDGTTFRRVLAPPSGSIEVAVTQPSRTESRLLVQVSGQGHARDMRANVTNLLDRLLGLSIDLSMFDRFARREHRLGLLANRFRGMRPPRFATVFEAALNAIACQQVSLTLGIHLLNRLSAKYGVSFEGEGAAYSFPRPIDLADRTPEELRELGLSRSKGRAMIELAQAISDGRLDLENFERFSDEEATKRLCAIRGIGRWSAEYILLRGLRRTHIFPGDDIGARQNLARWLRLDGGLDYEGVRRTLSPWTQYGGLIYFHLLLDRLAEAGFVLPA